VKTLRVTAKTLVIRSGPGRNCLWRRELHEGDILTGLGRDVVFVEGANWLAIETADGARGFVNQQVVTELPSPASVGLGSEAGLGKEVPNA
jgi:hypothetical protein